MKGNKIIILLSLSLVPLMVVVLTLDLADVFNYSDLPFFLMFLIYSFIVLIQRSSSKMSFFLALILLSYMALSYIPSGASATTERFGEWFYLFFVFGLIQYIKETLES